MSIDQRIQQFRQMAEADPDNELGHFSLGKAYLEAGRPTDAIDCFDKVLQIKPDMSKAYHLLGEALDKAGRRERAIEVMTLGVSIADQQGDRMPRDAMVTLLKEWDAPVPDVGTHATAAMPGAVAGMTTGFRCVRCGRPDQQLPRPPFKGELGQQIHAHVCQGCWREWIPMGTKVINELGLQLSTQQGQEAYDQYMIEFLQLDQV